MSELSKIKYQVTNGWDGVRVVWLIAGFGMIGAAFFGVESTIALFGIFMIVQAVFNVGCLFGGRCNR